VTADHPRGPARSWQRRSVVGLVFGALCVAALVVGGRALWRARALAAQRAAIVRALEVTPGLLVLTTAERGDVFCIRGLADPAARPPAEVAASVGHARARAGLALEFTPFEAPGCDFAEARLRRRLAPPSGVAVHVDEAGVARFSGEASASWIERARAVAPAVSGVSSVDLASLVDLDRRELARVAAELDGRAVRFPLGRADLGGDSDLADPRVGAAAARAGIAELGRAATRAGAFVRVELVHVHHTLERPDTELALHRIAAVRALLAADSGAWLLFEARPVPHDGVLLAESGAVRLSLQVLGPLAVGERVDSAAGHE
jgi:hypothetical protein